MADQPRFASRPSEHYLDAAASSTSPPHFAAPQSPDPLRGTRNDLIDGDPAALGKVRDVELDLTIELGRAEMLLEDVLKLEPGMVVPLDKRAGDPVDVVVNGRLVARGEVVVVDNHFCVRVVELVAAADAA